MNVIQIVYIYKVVLFVVLRLEANGSTNGSTVSVCNILSLLSISTYLYFRKFKNSESLGKNGQQLFTKQTHFLICFEKPLDFGKSLQYF
jgi:hypothetical protein